MKRSVFGALVLFLLVGPVSAQESVGSAHSEMVEVVRRSRPARCEERVWDALLYALQPTILPNAGNLDAYLPPDVFGNAWTCLGPIIVAEGRFTGVPRNRRGRMYSAASKLIRLSGRRESIPVFRKHLTHRDADIQRGAIDVVGALGDRQAVPTLCKLLARKHVQTAAASALGQIGDRAAIPALKRSRSLTSDPNFLRVLDSVLAQLDPEGTHDAAMPKIVVSFRTAIVGGREILTVRDASGRTVAAAPFDAATTTGITLARLELFGVRVKELAAQSAELRATMRADWATLDSSALKHLVFEGMVSPSVVLSRELASAGDARRRGYGTLVYLLADLKDVIFCSLLPDPTTCRACPGTPPCDTGANSCTPPGLGPFACCCLCDVCAYARGGTEGDRLRADQDLRACVTKVSPDMANIYYVVVRVFGWPCFRYSTPADRDAVAQLPRIEL